MQLEYRTLDVRSIDLEARTIELVVAPYGEVAELGGGRTEEYTRGVFGDLDGVVVPLKLETGPQHQGPIVGRALEFDDAPAGLTATFRVSETRDGDDALVLARDGVLGASAGFLPLEVRTSPKNANHANVARGDLREVTLTGVPAYRRAEVLAVRSTQEEPMPETTDAAEVAEETTDDVVADAVARALDGYRAGVAEVVPPTVTSKARGHQFRSLGELVRDVGLHARSADSGATERVTGLIEAGVVDSGGTAIRLDARAFTDPADTGVQGAGVIPDSYIPDLLELLREGRPVANQFGGRSLPADGENVVLPKVTTGSTVDYQATQGAEVDNTNVVTDSDTFPKSTLAGGQGVSIQAQRWTNPSYLDEVIRDLVAAYGEKVDSESIIGDGTTPNGTAYTGLLAGATDIDAGGTGVPADALAVIGSAWASVYLATRRAPSAALMHPLMWGGFLDIVDSDGRPIVTTDAPMNPAGLGDASQVVGTIRGLPVIVDSSIPTAVSTTDSPIVICNFRDALLFEDQGAPAQIALTYPDVLVTDVSVFGFSSLAIRRPGAFAAISGVATPS